MLIHKHSCGKRLHHPADLWDLHVHFLSRCQKRTFGNWGIYTRRHRRSSAVFRLYGRNGCYPWSFRRVYFRFFAFSIVLRFTAKVFPKKSAWIFYISYFVPALMLYYGHSLVLHSISWQLFCRKLLFRTYNLRIAIFSSRYPQAFGGIKFGSSDQRNFK